MSCWLLRHFFLGLFSPLVAAICRPCGRRPAPADALLLLRLLLLSCACVALPVRIHEIVIYTDFKLDESYTPSKISIRVGSTFHDLQEIHVEELNEPSGWVTILPPSECGAEAAEGSGEPKEPLRTHFIQVAILANHQNGRDTHIRQIKIYTPRRHLGQNIGCQHEFSSVAFQQYATIR